MNYHHKKISHALLQWFISCH